MNMGMVKKMNMGMMKKMNMGMMSQINLKFILNSVQNITGIVSI